MDGREGRRLVRRRAAAKPQINAPWHNALRLLDGWGKQFGGTPAGLDPERHAAQARELFNRRFWFEEAVISTT